MVKINIRDEEIVKLSLGASAAYGVHWMGFPAKAQNFNMPALEPRSNALARNLGLSVLQTTAVAFAANKAGANKKDLMTAMGACWGASAVNSAWNAHKGHQKEKEGFANAAVQATLAGVLLYRGLRK